MTHATNQDWFSRFSQEELEKAGCAPSQRKERLERQANKIEQILGRKSEVSVKMRNTAKLMK